MIEMAYYDKDGRVIAGPQSSDEMASLESATIPALQEFLTAGMTERPGQLARELRAGMAAIQDSDQKRLIREMIAAAESADGVLILSDDGQGDTDEA